MGGGCSIDSHPRKGREDGAPSSRKCLRDQKPGPPARSLPGNETIQRDFRPCLTVRRHKTVIVKSKSATTTAVRNDPRKCSQFGTKKASNEPTTACSTSRRPTLSQKTLFPHAGRKENMIVANSNKIYAAMTYQPAVSWKCS